MKRTRIKILDWNAQELKKEPRITKAHGAAVQAVSRMIKKKGNKHEGTSQSLDLSRVREMDGWSPLF